MAKQNLRLKLSSVCSKKAFKDGRDPWLALLDYRNTPTEGMKSSPTQRLMSRRTRTLLPTATSLLQPKVIQEVNERIKVKKQKAKHYQDRKARILPEIEIGQEVRVAPQERNQPWKSATCVKKLSDRSYLVETSSETLRRNRQSLKPAPPTSSQALGRQSMPKTPASTTVLYKSNSNGNRQISRFVHPIFPPYLGDRSRILATRQNDNSTRYRSFPVRSCRYLVLAKYRHCTSFEANPPVSKTAAIAPETSTAPQRKSLEVPASPKVLRTRSRTVKPPSRYQDFVTSSKEDLLV